MLVQLFYLCKRIWRRTCDIIGLTVILKLTDFTVLFIISCSVIITIFLKRDKGA